MLIIEYGHEDYIFFFVIYILIQFQQAYNIDIMLFNLEIIFRGLDPSSEVRGDIATTVNCLTTTNAGFLDLIKLFYLSLVI